MEFGYEGNHKGLVVHGSVREGGVLTVQPSYLERSGRVGFAFAVAFAGGGGGGGDAADDLVSVEEAAIESWATAALLEVGSTGAGTAGVLSRTYLK